MKTASGSKYKNLISNTLLFGLSTFGSRLLVFCMMPFYTRILSKAEYGMVDIVTGTCNLIVPIISLCVHEAVIRFGLESDKKKRDVLSTALLVIFSGYLLLLCFYPLLSKIELVAPYMRLIYLYVLTSALRSSVAGFVRVSGFVRLFAIDGIVTTLTTLTLNIIFLVRFELGVTGYVLATIIADAFSALSLILILKLYRFFRLRTIRRSTMRNMLAYCIPLMPTAVFWWVTNLSDRYFVTYMVGLDVNGLYNTAYKIPMMITLVSSVFTQAWQLSAFNEYEKADGQRFYSTVFRSYYTMIFVAASGIILMIKPITFVMVSKEFYDSWRYVPFLILAVSFSCLVTFLGTIYNAAKKNAMVTLTTFVGAAANITLNALLIPKYGANGAAFATFVSFFLVFIIRAIDSRRYVRLNMQYLRIGFTLIFLLVQCWLALSEVKLWVLWECVIFFFIVLCNFGNIVSLLRSGREMLPGRKG